MSGASNCGFAARISSTLHVASNSTSVLCNECDDELGALFEGGGQGYAETVSFQFFASCMTCSLVARLHVTLAAAFVFFVD